MAQWVRLEQCEWMSSRRVSLGFTPSEGVNSTCKSGNFWGHPFIWYLDPATRSKRLYYKSAQDILWLSELEPRMSSPDLASFSSHKL